MKKHITWESQAESLVHGGWGTEGDSIEANIKSNNDSRLMLCLLIDIARSLRALRCRNFLDIPGELRRTARAAEGIRRDRKAKRKR